MNENLSELVFILDRSGSMAGLEDDVTGSVNTLLEKYRQHSPEVRVTTVLASTRCVFLHKQIPITAVSPLTSEQYPIGGFSAILDAIGMAACHIQADCTAATALSSPKKVLFVILTDGSDNASIHFSLPHIQELMKAHPNWAFRFPGANLEDLARFSASDSFFKRRHCMLSGYEEFQRDYEILDDDLRAYRLKSEQAAAEWDTPAPSPKD